MEVRCAELLCGDALLQWESYSVNIGIVVTHKVGFAVRWVRLSVRTQLRSEVPESYTYLLSASASPGWHWRILGAKYTEFLFPIYRAYYRLAGYFTRVLILYGVSFQLAWS